jgi:ribosomal protein L12E/L44/L45/RPP1/RPP2
MSAQLACTYAAFIAEKADAASIQAILKAAGVDVPAAYATTFAGIYAKNDATKILKNVSFGGGAGAAAPAAAAAAPAAGKAAPAAAAPAAAKEEEDEEMGFGLFD